MKRRWGFTLLEILFVVAIIGILVAIAYPFYRDYQARSRASQIILKYDALREGIGADLAQSSVENCAELASRANPGNLQDEHAKLAIGFEKGAGGYRAVLSVCAEVAQQGARGIAVAREAHDVFVKTNRVEQGAVLTHNLVSFAVPLSRGDAAACRVAPANLPVQCGGGTGPGVGAVVPQALPPPSGSSVTGSPQSTGTPSPTAAQTVQPAQAPVQCPDGGEPVKAEDASYRPIEVCLPKCPAGQTRDPANPGNCLPGPAQSAQPTNVAPAQQSPRPAQGASQTGTSVPQSGSQAGSTQSKQQCESACRTQFPHGYSRAYRECVARCG